MGHDAKKTAATKTDVYRLPETRMDAEALAAGTTANASTSATPVGTPPAVNSFSIFWITDTQFLSESNPALFKMMNNWIVNNWDAYNGKLVIHTGDMVQTGNVQHEWENANDAMTVFLDNAIPYTWCAGNHDNMVLGDESSGWSGNLWGGPAFDPVAVSKIVNGGEYPTGYYTNGYSSPKNTNAKWVGDYHSGMDTALSFTANGFDFLVINIEWNADATVLDWVGEILDDQAYASHNVIIAPHAYIDAWGVIDDARWGPTLASFVKGLTPLLDAHPSVFLTLNGHFATESGYNLPAPIHGRNQLMFDRQDCCDLPNGLTGRGVDETDSSTSDGDKVGGATVTILNFDTTNNQILVSTYDVYTGQWRVDPPNQYAITMFTNPPAGDGSGALPYDETTVVVSQVS